MKIKNSISIFGVALLFASCGNNSNSDVSENHTIQADTVKSNILSTNRNNKIMGYDIEQLMKSTGSIGALTKEADNTFEKLIRKTSFGDFDRDDWQLLNFLHNNPETTTSALVEFMSFLLQQDETKIRMKKFEEKGLILLQGNDVILTTIGKEAFDETYNLQKEMLEVSFKGIAEEEYKICIGVLKKMIENMSPYTRKSND